MISREKKFVFVHIYKTGGTSLTRALLPFVSADLHPGNPRHEGLGWQGSWHFRNGQHAKLAPALPALRRHGLGDLSGYRIVTFVRDPYSWVHSIWRSFYTSGGSEGRAAFTARFPGGGLDDFCRFIAEEQARPQTRHWGMKPQVSFFEIPGRAPDFIGRFEEYEAEVARLMQFLGLPPLEAVPHELRRRRRTFDLGVYAPESLEIINHVMAPDFRSLGYPVTTAA